MTTIEKILTIINESKLTAKEFAERAGIAGGNITDWKTGRSKPSVESLQKISNYANVTLEWLTGISYFKNEIDYATSIGFVTAFLQVISLDECRKLEDYINLLLGNNSNTELDNLALSVPKIFNRIEKTDAIKAIEILYHDYNEHKDTYKIIYGVNQFSISVFLKHVALIYASKNPKIQKEISNKINELEGSSLNIAEKALPKSFRIPIVGRIAAGQPILAEEYLEGYLPVDPNIYGMTTPDDYFYLKVSGESMNLKVHNGDYALVHKQDYAENGDIVVAVVNGDDEATLKRYKIINNEMIMLEPMSSYPMEPLIIDLKNTKFQIIGKAIGQFGKW